MALWYCRVNGYLVRIVVKMKNVEIVQYAWEGKWGPFKIKGDCSECDITWATLQSMKDKEFKNKPIKIKKKPWLNNWIYCILKLTWHAPIIIVDGKKIHQFSEKDPFFDRKKLTDLVLQKLKAV